MARGIVVAALAVVCATSAIAGMRARVQQCKQLCGNTIQQCVDQGGRPRKCRRTVLRQCKHEGIAMCVPPLPGATYDVATSGSDDPTCGTSGAPCRTIQYVIDALIPLGGAGTIKVATGTYDEVADCPTGAIPNQAVVCILNKQITLLGGYSTSDWDTPSGDPSATVLDGKGVGRGLRIQLTGPNQGTASVELDGFTITNGLAQGASTGDIDKTYAFGGGMFGEHSAVVLKSVVFRGNRVVGGSLTQAEGGRSAGGGLAMNNDSWSTAQATATLEHVTFDSNESHGGDGAAEGGDAHGGGMFTYWVTMTGDDVTFTNNTAVAGTSNGVGYVGQEKSDALGGGASIEAHSVVDLHHVHAGGNTAIGGPAPNGEAGGGYGGAFMAELATLSVTDGVVTGNRAQGGDGQNTTTSASLAEGGGIHTGSAGLTLDRVVVVGNEARAGNGSRYGGAPGGGGVSVTFGSGNGVDAPFALTNCVVADNLVSLGSGALIGGGGGGLWIQAAVGTIDQTTIANNRLGDSRLLGAGIAELTFTGWQAQLTLEHGIVANHTSKASNPSSWGDAALYVAQNATANVTRTLFANNLHDSNGGISGGLNLPPGTVNMTNVLTASDAGFVSAGAPGEDYHLTAGSPAIDQATGSTVTVDLDGQARPNGAAADLGAYEFVP